VSALKPVALATALLEAGRQLDEALARWREAVTGRRG
jgi:hypothetical protein